MCKVNELNVLSFSVQHSQFIINALMSKFGRRCNTRRNALCNPLIITKIVNCVELMVDKHGLVDSFMKIYPVCLDYFVSRRMSTYSWSW